MSKSLKRGALALIGPVLILLIWFVMADVIDNKLILPAPDKVFKHFITPLANIIGLGALTKNILVSLFRVFFGYLIAIIIAVPLGILMGYSRTANELGNSVISIFRPVPPIAWQPLVLAWFGVTSAATLMGLTRGDAYVYLNNFKISMTFIIFLGAFFPIVTSSIHAVSSIPKTWIESARVLGANEWDIFRKILLPGAAPTIINGMRTGLGSAWTCLVSAEMLPGSLSGVGYLITHAYEIARVDVVITGMISIGMIGAFLDFAFRFLESRKFKWQHQIK
ncbi:MAG: ABC transporter permease [Syntrophomonadaceae bacterium]|jgi:NitT/TauT family transport system permease protein|nr:ABC transporter permease [Syntrophomonadaceae bacterium]